MPPPNRNLFDDVAPTNPDGASRAVTDPSMQTVAGTPAGIPTIVEMPVAQVDADESTTTRKGIPEQFVQQPDDPQPRPVATREPASMEPAPRVTASEVASVSALRPRRRRQRLMLIGAAVVALALVLLAVGALIL